MHVNLTAPVLLACAMAQQGDLDRGAVVNLLDQKLANLNPDFFSYTCSKVALAGATPMLAMAFGDRISVNAVAPGLTLPSLDQTADEFTKVAAANLLRRPVGADQVAAAVAFLLEARGITGQTLFVDAGQRFLPLSRDVMFSTREAVNG
jgi:NAD(P)-dependent dehydrogenase (short-subunit alcohol dehydrogenase family)